MLGTWACAMATESMGIMQAIISGDTCPRTLKWWTNSLSETRGCPVGESGQENLPEMPPENRQTNHRSMKLQQKENKKLICSPMIRARNTRLFRKGS